MGRKLAEDLVERIRVLYIEKNHTARETALILKLSDRGCVLGLASRRGWQKPEADVKRARADNEAARAAVARRVRQRVRVKPVPPIVERPSTPPPAVGMRLSELNGSHCRWPINTWRVGDGETAKFCGALGSPYCAFHHTKAHAVQQGDKRSHHASRPTDPRLEARRGAL